MLAGTYNIICEQGATFDQLFTWKDENSNSVNLTGYTAEMQVRTSKCDEDCAELIIELNTENTRIVLGGVLGTIQLLISAATTTTLDVGQYYYDLVLISGSNKYRLIQGSFTVSGGITQ